nr:hypothetical protein [Sandaracinaceae bacterium]
MPLETGFTPDPLRFAGQTRGARPLGELAPGCRGYVGDAPDHVVRLDTDFPFLRWFVRPQDPSARLTLALRGADGRWHCSG